MKKAILRSLYCCLLLSLSIHTFAQSKLIEKVERKGSELLISYEKYILANGLTVIVHEDHSDPVVHVDVTYHVGSAREEIGKSGFAIGRVPNFYGQSEPIPRRVGQRTCPQQS